MATKSPNRRSASTKSSHRRSPRKKNTYSKPLTKEKLAGAAIEIVRKEGPAALSMRKVAGLFGVDVAALYRHVKNKDELLSEAGRLAASLVEIETPLKGDWQERFFGLAYTLRKRIATHPELSIYGGDSLWATPFTARANGLIAELLYEAGLRGTKLVFGSQTVLHLLTSIAQSEVMTRDTPVDLNRTFAKSIFEHLSEDVQKAWPTTTVKTDWSVDYDEFFDFALRSVLSSLDIEASSRPAR